MEGLNLQNIHDIMIGVGRDAASIIFSYPRATLKPTVQTNSTDLVTTANYAVEEMVLKRLKDAYPDFCFMGKYTKEPGAQLTNAPTFLVDPINGTMNFVHFYPILCVSIGFVVNKVPTIGVVINPFANWTYSAIKGQGASVSMKVEKLHLPFNRSPAPLRGLSNAMVAMDWGNQRDGPNFVTKSHVFSKLVASKESGGSMIQDIRNLGSKALNMIAVGGGTMDVYWDGGLDICEVAAPLCISLECGARLVGANPGEWDATIESKEFLVVRGASSGQDELIEEFWAVLGENRLKY